MSGESKFGNPFRGSGSFVDQQLQQKIVLQSKLDKERNLAHHQRATWRKGTKAQQEAFFKR